MFSGDFMMLISASNPCFLLINNMNMSLSLTITIKYCAYLYLSLPPTAELLAIIPEWPILYHPVSSRNVVCAAHLNVTYNTASPLGTRHCSDVESTALTLIQRRNDVVSPVGGVDLLYEEMGNLSLSHHINPSINS